VGSTCSALVIFGVTGDLVRKKVFASLYELQMLDRLNMPVIGVGRSDWTDDTLRHSAESAIRSHAAGDLVHAAMQAVLDRLTYVRGDYSSPVLYESLQRLVASHELVLCYLAVPPTVFGDIVNGLGGTNTSKRARLLIEKPFGSDLKTAQSLRILIEQHFDAEQLFAVDHYLQKESLQNILVLRFGNRVLEPTWNRKHISGIAVTMAEAFGIEGRAGFFDSNGTLRDVVQNHMFQTVAALAMEAPASSSTRDMNDARAHLLGCIAPLDLTDVVFGQYDGYLDVHGVNPDSTTDTFVQARLAIDNDRWRDVSWTITAGKALAESLSEVVVTFKAASAPMFISDECEPEPNELRIRMAPEESIVLTMQARSSAMPLGTARTTLASTDSYRSIERLDPYARILDDARRGDQTQFASCEVLEQSWRILDGVVNRTSEPEIYLRGSEGPRLVRGERSNGA
jgi:glucose-6-phosphate 1-dehydrogenase